MTSMRAHDRTLVRARILLSLGLPPITAAVSLVACSKGEPTPEVARPTSAIENEPKPKPTVSESASASASELASTSASAPLPILVPPVPVGVISGGGCGFQIDCVPGAKTAPKAAASAPYTLCALGRPSPDQSLGPGTFDAEHTEDRRTIDKKPNLCCYRHPRMFCGGGRVLRDGGSEPIVAAPILRARGDWDDEGVAALELPRDEARANHWLREAAFEHASVASFSRVVLELMALGAPADLIADTTRAALDEIRHARVCYALAHAHGAPLHGPGPLALDRPGATDGHPRSEEPSDRFAALVEATFADACVSETIAVLELRARANDEPSPAVRALLLGIADDEDRHVVLAFRTVRWAIEAGGAPARTAFEAAVRSLRAACAPSTSAADRGSGHDPRNERDAIVRDVVLPCAESLLAASLQRSASWPS